jgi:hypothetical protein
MNADQAPSKAGAWVVCVPCQQTLVSSFEPIRLFCSSFHRGVALHRIGPAIYARTAVATPEYAGIAAREHRFPTREESVIAEGRGNPTLAIPGKLGNAAGKHFSDGGRAILFESFSWDAPRWERLSGQTVLPGYLTGLCVDQRWGELPRDPAYRFRNAVHLADEWALTAKSIEYIVWQKPYL